MDNKTKFHVKEDEGPLTLRFMFSNLPPGNLSATCKTIDNTASKFWTELCFTILYLYLKYHNILPLHTFNPL